MVILAPQTLNSALQLTSKRSVVYSCLLTRIATLFRGGARSQTVNADDQARSVMLQVHVTNWHRLGLWQVEKFAAYGQYSGGTPSDPVRAVCSLYVHATCKLSFNKHLTSIHFLTWGQLTLTHVVHKVQHQPAAQGFCFFRQLLFRQPLRCVGSGNLTGGRTAVAETPGVKRLETTDRQTDKHISS